MNEHREGGLVELVSAEGAPVGAATVAEAHAAPGRLHRAFSVLLFDAGGRTLLQQRSQAKTRFPLKWANACCGHPSPGEPVAVAASRRLSEELGVELVKLAVAGVYVYAAVDAASGRVEREYDHVLVGRVSENLQVKPDALEVAGTRWIATDSLRNELRANNAEQYAPWLQGVLNVALDSSVFI